MSIGASNASARESEAFRPSSFASRLAARAARGELGPRPRRLVSLGVREQVLEGLGRNARRSVVRVEYFCDRDAPSEYFIRHLPHGTIERVDRGGIDQAPPELLCTLPEWPQITSGYFPDSLPDQPATLLT